MVHGVYSEDKEVAFFLVVKLGPLSVSWVSMAAARTGRGTPEVHTHITGSCANSVWRFSMTQSPSGAAQQLKPSLKWILQGNVLFAGGAADFSRFIKCW